MSELNENITTADRLELANAQWAQERPDADMMLFQLASSISMLAQTIDIEFRGLAQRLRNGLGPSELRILLVLRRFGRSSQQRPVDLLRYVLVTSGAMAKQIARLEAKRLVTRSRVPGCRGWHISLTEEGERIAFEAIKADALPVFSAALSHFPRKEQQEVVQFLRKLISRTSGVGDDSGVDRP